MIICCITYETIASVQKPKMHGQDGMTRTKVATNVSRTVPTTIEVRMVRVSQLVNLHTVHPRSYLRIISSHLSKRKSCSAMAIQCCCCGIEYSYLALLVVMYGTVSSHVYTLFKVGFSRPVICSEERKKNIPLTCCISLLQTALQALGAAVAVALGFCFHR
jgi:hypothetical protein